MDALSPEERSEQGRKAADARWKSKPLLKASHAGVLPLGDAKIQCYVLEDGTRVLSQRGLNEAFGIQHGGALDRGQKMPRIVAVKALEPYISNDLMAGLLKPLRFTPPHGGNPVLAIPATVLPEICNAWLRAREAKGLTNARHLATAQEAEIIMRGLAHLGIIALVDEATGYQKDRAKDALAKILEAFIAKELQAWVPTFPSDFYEQMFKLRGIDFPTSSVKRPQYFGVLTNDIVHKRLAPGVLAELKKATPRNDLGRPKAKYFQSLTGNLGYPKLKEHLGAVVALMRISKSWSAFMNLLDEHYPRFGDTVMLPLDYDQRTDDGRGI